MSVTPTKIASYASLAVMAALLLSALLFFSIFDLQKYPGILFFILLCILSFASCYFIFLYVLDKFIYSKIKNIQKNIFDFSGAHGKKPPEKNKDLISEVHRDVRQWARDKEQEIEQLRKLEGYRKEFLGNVSHELKTPIFNIQGYIHTLIDGAIDDPEFNREFLRKAALSVDRLCTIVDDLEAISQLEEERFALEKNKFDLVKLTAEVFESLERQAGSRNIQLNFKEVYSPFWAYADRDRIRQVLNNLIYNSIKYSKDKGGRTEVAFYDKGENILVEVADNGIGIAEEHLPRLFERFYRVDKSRSRERGGSGLGLSIVKHILEAHNQSIKVKSDPGQGTTFTFTIEKAKFNLRPLKY